MFSKLLLATTTAVTITCKATRLSHVRVPALGGLLLLPHLRVLGSISGSSRRRNTSM